jgi:uncharacterized protein YjhX (UPF0386 family)
MTILQDPIDQFTADAAIAHQIVHGDSDTSVTTEGGPVRTLAKVIGDAQTLMDAETAILHAVAQGDANTVVATASGNIDSVAKAVSTLKAFNARGAWAAGMTLALKDVVTYNGMAYVSLNAAAYVSNDVPTDLAAGRLTIHQGATREDLASTSGTALVGFLQVGAGAVARTAQDKLFDVVSLRDFGAIGDGLTLDTVASLAALKSNRKVLGKRGDVYRIAPLVLTDVQHLEIDLQGATLLVDAPAPTGQAQNFCLKIVSSTQLGVSADIRVKNGKIAYVNPPSSRVDNNFCIYGDGIDGLEIANIECAGSWSAALWARRSNNVEIHHCYVHDSKADGITLQGCGTNLRIHDNRVSNTGDDSIAVTWFTGDDPTYVGLTDGIKKSRDVEIYNNRCISSTQRGIFCGGILNGAVHHNYVQYSNSIGIHLARNTVDTLGADGATANPFYSAAGVNNSNASLAIHHNWVWDCALNSNTPFPQLAGIWVSEGNYAINIHDNDLQRCNNASIYCGGNANIHHNASKDPQLQAGGSVTLAQMTYKGSHIVTGNFTSNTGSNSGSITDNEMYGGLARAIWLGAGDNVRSWKVHGNKTYDVGNPTNASDTLTIGAPYVVDTINNTEWGYNSVIDDRPASTIPATLQLLNSGGTLARRPKKIVSGTTYASDIVVGTGASVDPRTQLTATSTQLALTVPANTRIYFDVSVPGAQIYAKSRALAPGNLGGVLVFSEPLVTGGSVRNSLFNSTAADITIAAGNWLISLGE